MIETIPLRSAVLCETCLVITTSKGESCDYCGAKTLARLQAMLELERVPAAWLEAIELMQSYPPRARRLIDERSDYENR